MGKRMEAFITKLWNESYDRLTIQYHNAVNELEMRKRSLGDVASRHDLTFLPAVPLPEFDVREVIFPEEITDVQYLNETSVVVLSYNNVRIVDVVTGETLRTTPHQRHCRYYQNKTVHHDADVYEETETTVMIPEDRSAYPSFYTRNAEGRIQGFKNMDYLFSHGEAFRRENEVWFSCHYVVILHNIITQEETAFFVRGGRQQIFRYRGEWYQYGRDDKTWHCHSRVEVPFPIEGNNTVYVCGERIFLLNKTRGSGILQILTPRLPAE